MERYRPKLFHGEPVPDLPHVIHTGESSIVIEYLREVELPLVVKIIQEAAEQGYNVGADEFTEDGLNYQMMLPIWNIFTIRLAGREDIIGLIAISPSTYCRGWMPTYGLFNIFFTKTLHTLHPEVYSLLVEETETLSRVIYPEHLGLSTSVFAVHVDWLKQLSGRGYDFSVCVPLAGNPMNLQDVESYLLSKRFSDREPNMVDIDKKVFDGALFYKKAYEDLTADTEPPIIESLPVVVHMRKLGRAAIFRNGAASDCRRVWDLLQHDMAHGAGYSVDEYPGYEAFAGVYLSSYNILLMEEDQDVVIAYLSFRPQFPSRQESPKLASTSITISPKYRGNQLTYMLHDHLLMFLQGLGYKGILADSFMSNVPMQEAQRRLGYVKVGVVPYAGCLAGQGLSHSVTSYLKLKSNNTAKL